MKQSRGEVFLSVFNFSPGLQEMRVIQQEVHGLNGNQEENSIVALLQLSNC